MFILILGAILGLMHLYLWKRLIKDTTGPGHTRWVLTSALVALLVLLFAALILPRVIGVTDSRWFAWPGYLWFGTAAYLFLILLVLEPVRLALRGWVKRRHAVGDDAPEANRRALLARASAATAGAVAVLLVGVGTATAMGPPNVEQVPVQLAQLDPAFDGFRIAVVADIHLGPLLGRAHSERIVQTINDTDPDLVLIVGDLVDGTVEDLAPAVEPFRDLVSREGTFFATGNHEYYVDDTSSWLRKLQRLGVRPLRNESVEIRRGDAAVDLVGVNDIAGEQFSDGPDYDSALSGLDASRPIILLAHQPVMVDDAAARDVDLQLSGHTHGGQMWPFHFAVRAVQPTLAGLSTVDGTQLYVTRGAGFWGPPIRIGAPPDITVLTLQTAD